MFGKSHRSPGSPLMNCPRCATPADEGAVECRACGVVFAKWRAPLPPSETVSPVAPTRPAARPPAPWSLQNPPPPPPPETLGIPHAGWRAAGLGLGMAAALTFFPFLSFILSPLSTMVHEIGHTVVLWLFGYSAIPAFDFAHGGGVTMSDLERSSLIVWAWVAGALILAWWQREKPFVLAGLGALALVYFMMFNRTGETLAITLGGHGGEILFGALFLYRGLTGWGCKVEGERPLYAFLAFMILFSSIRLGVSLLGNSLEKAYYLQGKGGIDNDLVTGAQILSWRLEGMARALIAFTLLAIPAAFVAASMRKTIGAVSEAEEAAAD
jgi:hypothetical protein